MQDDPLLIARDGHCAVMTLNRPNVLNALSGDLRRRLITGLAELDRDESVRVVVLTGAGRAFTAGLDLKELAASGESVSVSIDNSNVAAAIERFSKPIIAAVNGDAVTGGVEIILACDMVLASEAARFADTHVKVGLTPGWGLSQRLSRLVGVFRAKEMSLSARFVSAREALEWGLVNRVVAAADLMPQALELAHAIAGWDPSSVREMKALIDRGRGMPIGEAIAMEAATASRRNAAVTMQATVLRKG